jgi:hypothetical protein
MAAERESKKRRVKVQDDTAGTVDLRRSPATGAETLDLTDASFELFQKEARAARDDAAKEVAERLLAFFGWTLLALFLGGLLLLGFGMLLDVSKRGGDLVTANQLLASYAKILQSIILFVATLFGPLLGFILGHYFARREG